MIDLNINVEDIAEEFSLSQREVNALLEYSVETITAAYARQWDIEAKSNLGKTRNQYRSAINVAKRGRFTGVVYLNPASWLANALELGADAFDMKVGFLKSSKVKYTKDNKPFLTIPFRFATSQALGESSAFAGIMPGVIEKAVKAHEEENPDKKGLPLSKIPSKYHIPKSATLRRELKSQVFKNLESNIPVTSIYEGLKRNEKGSGYVMFRRVSINSHEDRWQHPGIMARDLAGKAVRELEPRIPFMVEKTVDDFLQNLGF